MRQLQLEKDSGSNNSNFHSPIAGGSTLTQKPRIKQEDGSFGDQILDLPSPVADVIKNVVAKRRESLLESKKASPRKLHKDNNQMSISIL